MKIPTRVALATLLLASGTNWAALPRASAVPGGVLVVDLGPVSASNGTSAAC
jgi:hypothetical protein